MRAPQSRGRHLHIESSGNLPSVATEGRREIADTLSLLAQEADARWGARPREPSYWPLYRSGGFCTTFD